MVQWSRREFLRYTTVGTATGVAGCSAFSPSDSDTDSSSTAGDDREPSAQLSEPISGEAVGLSGNAIADVTLDVIVPGRGAVARTKTDGQGQFEIEGWGTPVWLRATASEFIPRTIAVAPGANRRIALTPRDGTVSLAFGGDMMFGRRFYEDDDPLEPHFQIQQDELRSSHDAILRGISPLLADADITSVNLETPLTTTAWRHPSKRYTFVSHPEAAAAMGRAEIDYAALGNNHTLDALTPGLDDTLQTLSDSGIESSGAGDSNTEAWQPAYIEVQGLTVGLLSCTTVTGEQYDMDWSADDGQSETHTVANNSAAGSTDAETLTVPGGVGVAAATESRLAEHVTQTETDADVTVVQIHGGEEYRQEPTEQMERLTDTAISAGADIVVHHHPHVTGGLELRDGAVVAWTLGNLVFDQELWSTLPSYVLTVHATDDGITRAYIEPLLIEGYVPKGIVGKPRTWQLRRTAGLSSREFSLGDGSLEYIADRNRDTRAATRTLSGRNMIYRRESGWVNRVQDGKSSVEPGRDLLPTGTFDNPDIDDDRYEGALWRFGRGENSNGPEFGYDGSGGIQLSRVPDNTQRSILTTAARMPLAGPTTLLGQYRHESDARLELLVRWYESTSGSALDSVSINLGQTTGWERLRQPLQTAAEANYIRFYFRLYPPGSGKERVVRIDNLRLIEWSDTVEGDKKEYDHLRVRDTATIEFATDDLLDEEISWTEIE